ncbi:MAG: hypothetical protein IPL27_20025 [Lewinellaceae bacterium]|nr:hypothetical protein [Lewinellaceae bacterium]
MADRYLFIPSLGISLIMMELCWFLGGVSPERPVFQTLRSRVMIGLLLSLCIAFFARTWVANRDWENDVTLIKNRIQYMENNAAAQATLGVMLYRESQAASSETQHRALKQEAMQAYMRAIDIYPDFGWAWISVGKIFAEEKYSTRPRSLLLKHSNSNPLTRKATIASAVCISRLAKATWLCFIWKKRYSSTRKWNRRSYYWGNRTSRTMTSKV